MEVRYNWTNRSGATVRDTLQLAMDAPPGRMPGWRDIGRSFNGNLTWNRDELQARYTLAYGFTRKRSSSADPQDWLPMLARPWINEARTWSHSLNLRHEFSPRLSYSAMVGYYNRFSESFDSELGDDLMAYGDSERNPALLDRSLIRSYYMASSFAVRYPGSPLSNTYAKDSEERLSAKLDLDIQVSRNHRLVLGVEAQQERIRRYALNAVALAQRYYQTHDLAGNLSSYLTEWDVYSALSPLVIGYDWEGNQTDKNIWATTVYGVQADEQGNPIETAIKLRTKPMTPLTASVSLTNQITIKNMSFSLGMRVDHVRSGMSSLKDFTRLCRTPGTLISDEDYGPEKRFTHVSPQISLTIPIMGLGHLHANYNQAIQPVSSDWLWGRSGFNGISRQIFNAPYYSPQPNPNLRPERQSAIELGFLINFTPSFTLDVTGFYRDVRDLLALHLVAPAPDAGLSPSHIVLE